MQILLNIFFYKIFYTTYMYYLYICDMTKKITDLKAKRLERNAKIREKYYSQLSEEGSMRSAIISSIAKSYNMTIPTVYSILKEVSLPASLLIPFLIAAYKLFNYINV